MSWDSSASHETGGHPGVAGVAGLSATERLAAIRRHRPHQRTQSTDSGLSKSLTLVTNAPLTRTFFDSRNTAHRNRHVAARAYTEQLQARKLKRQHAKERARRRTARPPVASLDLSGGASPKLAVVLPETPLMGASSHREEDDQAAHRVQQQQQQAPLSARDVPLTSSRAATAGDVHATGLGAPPKTPHTVRLSFSDSPWQSGASTASWNFAQEQQLQQQQQLMQQQQQQQQQAEYAAALEAEWTAGSQSLPPPRSPSAIRTAARRAELRQMQSAASPEYRAVEAPSSTWQPLPSVSVVVDVMDAEPQPSSEVQFEKATPSQLRQLRIAMMNADRVARKNAMFERKQQAAIALQRRRAQQEAEDQARFEAIRQKAENANALPKAIKQATLSTAKYQRQYQKELHQFELAKAARSRDREKARNAYTVKSIRRQRLKSRNTQRRVSHLHRVEYTEGSSYDEEGWGDDTRPRTATTPWQHSRPASATTNMMQTGDGASPRPAGGVGEGGGGVGGEWPAGASAPDAVLLSPGARDNLAAVVTPVHGSGHMPASASVDMEHDEG